MVVKKNERTKVAAVKKPPGKAPHAEYVKDKSHESWIWDAACSIRGAKDAPKYKDFMLPLIFTKRLCDVFDDELNCIAAEVGSRKRAFQLAKRDHKLVRFFLPLEPKDPDGPVWSVIRKLADEIGNTLKNRKFRQGSKLRTFDRVVVNPMWNQDWFTEADYDNDKLERFPSRVRILPSSTIP